MKAMIFAAGLGTRLRPITDTLPKALVPVGGVPMLERVLVKLRDAGIAEFVVNACYLSEKIVSFFDTHDFGVKVAVSLEDGLEPLETGGGIKHAAPLLATASGTGRFLLHNADILSDLDVRWFLSEDDPCALATLLLVDKPADRYLLFDDDMRLRGWTNVRTGEVKSPFPGFDPSSCRRYSFCGIHILSEMVLAMMESWPERFGIIDFYLSACAGHTIRGVVASGLDITDIGSPETLRAADEKMAFQDGFAPSSRR